MLATYREITHLFRFKNAICQVALRLFAIVPYCDSYQYGP